MSVWQRFHSSRVVNAAPITHIEEATSTSPAMPRRLFVIAPEGDDPGEQFIPSDPKQADSAKIGDIATMDHTGHHAPHAPAAFEELHHPAAEVASPADEA